MNTCLAGRQALARDDSSQTMENLLPNKSKGITTAIVLAAVAGLVLVLLGIPSLRGLKYQAQAEAQTKYDYESGKRFIGDIEQTYSRLTSSGVDILLGIASPADTDISAALVQLDAMVSESGLALNSLSPSTEGGQTNIGTIVSGEFEKLQTFLKLIETNLRPFNVQSVSINSFEADGKIITAGTYEIILSKKSTGSVSAATGGKETVTVTSGE